MNETVIQVRMKVAKQASMIFVVFTLDDLDGDKIKKKEPVGS